MDIRKERLVRGMLLATTGVAVLAFAPPVRAQNASGVALEEVIVTARKRQESILNVPVVENAIPQQQLERLQAKDLKDVAKLAPGLMLGDNVLSVGTQVSIRGVGTSELDPGVDASVSLSVDGLQLTQGLAYASGMFDVGQVEVLKGPQSLFYGKTSTGGVISLRTADPTSTPEIIARAGYEFESRQKEAQLIVSGPITDTLKARLAGYYSRQDGFYYNNAVAIPALGAMSPSKRMGGSKNYVIRGTLLWNPTSAFDARLKINQVHDTTNYEGTLQWAVCPGGTTPVPGLGIPFFSPNENCKLDRYNAVVDLDPKAFPGIGHGGKPYLEQTQTYGSLELNYRPRNDITVTSTTAYYLVHEHSLYGTQGGASGPFLGVTNGFHRRELTEELRANSDFSGPLNFTVGGFLQRARFNDNVTIHINQAIPLGLPPILQDGNSVVDIHTESVFGQLRYKITPQLELAAGARWTDEKRVDNVFNALTQAPTPLLIPGIRSKTTSPEVTLTYKPADNLTFFGALKKGYKSGSFNVGTPPQPQQDVAFGDEKVEGGEVGMKSRWLDRRLAFDIAAYDYKYTGLQVGANTPTTNGVVEERTVNAGSSKVYGVESDIAYHPEEVPGLDLHASVNWNHARFKILQHVPCYGDQLQSEGCPSAAAGQDLSGLPLIRAPKWQANFGFDYEKPVGGDMKVVVASSTQYSSSYLTNLGYQFYQKSFYKTDLSLTLEGPKDRWEVALIGKNLNNALTTGNCANADNRAGLLGFQNTGGTVHGPAGADDTGCWMDRGRELWVRVTFKPLS
jgi:outer membrane receptor protein involved in Fe transport